MCILGDGQFWLRSAQSEGTAAAPHLRGRKEKPPAIEPCHICHRVLVPSEAVLARLGDHIPNDYVGVLGTTREKGPSLIVPTIKNTHHVNPHVAEYCSENKSHRSAVTAVLCPLNVMELVPLSIPQVLKINSMLLSYSNPCSAVPRHTQQAPDGTVAIACSDCAAVWRHCHRRDFHFALPGQHAHLQD